MFYLCVWFIAAHEEVALVAVPAAAAGHRPVPAQDPPNPHVPGRPGHDLSPAHTPDLAPGTIATLPSALTLDWFPLRDISNFRDVH